MACACQESLPRLPCAIPLQIFTGSAPTWPVDIVDQSTRAALNDGLSGASIEFNVINPDGGATVVSLTTSGGEIAITDAAACEIQINWTATLTGALTQGYRYNYELIVTMASGEIYPAAWGSLTARSATPVNPTE